MELRNLILNFKNNWKFLVAVTFLGGVLGLLVFYFVPVKYQVVGTVFVTRESESYKRTDFTYEGYYAQQTAKNYTKTLIGILESVEARKEALQTMGIPVTENSLRKAKRNLSIKEFAPQMVTVQVKDLDSEKAKEYWEKLTEVALKSADQLNKNSDSMLRLTITEGSPTVYKGFHNIWFNIYLGAALGLFLGIFSFSIKEYLKK